MSTTEKTPASAIDELLSIMAALRTPGTGCPWDLQQTFKTIAPYTIEEAYEVADAIARDDLADLKDELGDLLLQVVYHARMAEEENAFAFEDVARAISAKMVRRHPHVFGTPEERAAGAAPDFWEKLKAREKAAKQAERAKLSKGTEAQTRATSILDDTPATLPGMTRALKLQNKAARVGFDWPSLEPVFDKLREELDELQDAIKQDGAKNGSAHVAEEFGDLLFVMANLGRHLGVEPETAVRSANEKFIRRFHYIEAELLKRGSSPAQSTLEEMDALWNEAKAREK